MRKLLITLVAVFSLAGVLTVGVKAEPAEAHTGSHAAVCYYSGYSASASGYSTSNGARNACLVYLGRRIFGNCYQSIGGMISFYNSPTTYWFLGKIYSVSGNYYCGQQQVLQANGYVDI